MAGASLLTLIDKIALMLDDVALLTKVAAKKTAGVLGDDLALNAQQVSGVKADRELPVVWAVAKGSFINKLILVPAALAISATLPWLITPLLMLGGAYLCFEGVEKIAHSFTTSKSQRQAEHQEAQAELLNAELDLVELEKDKIKGAIRTDFILSAEIIVIALGTVQSAEFSQQVMVVSLIALVMTVGVYGLVAGIVKLDDAGLYLIQKDEQTLMGKFQRMIGQGLLSFAPWLMKALAVIGTLAMFLVGGSILLHGIPQSHHFIETVVMTVGNVPYLGAFLSAITPLIGQALTGLLAGAIVLSCTSLVKKFI